MSEPISSDYVHIHWTEEHEEVSRTSIGEKWCFVCRARRDFEHVVDAPVGLSWYGPTHRIACTVCKTTDGDVFPGIEREWGDE